MAADLTTGDTALILDVCRERGALRNQAAYILATARWETAHTLEPVRETLAKTDAQMIARLDAAWKKGQLKWVSKPYWRDGFAGRGFVQLTHRENYERAGKEIGVDLVGNPSLALVPRHAALILVRGMMEGWFTGKRLGDYVTLQKSDFTGARRVVNGTDKAAQIADLARIYDRALLEAGYGVRPDMAQLPDADPAPTGWAAIWTAILNLLRRR